MSMNRTKRSIALFIALLITVFIVSIASLNNVHDANATGGAFPYTKHGGGTTDGLTPYDRGNGPGVDRAVNPAYGTHYNSLNPEAGKYKGGECTQCHEPHASFGESEAPPSTSGDAGPDAYLALKDYGTSTNYANLCWYCHENFSNINSSGSPLGMGRWSFYQGTTVYQSSSHYQSSNFYWPGTSGDLTAIWPRQSRSSQPSGNKGSCLNCHTPHGVKEGGISTAFDTTAVPTSPTNLHLAANNASVSTDYLIPRQLIAWEEALCENCHDGSPAGTNIEAEINKRSPSPSSVARSGHPIDDTSLAGKHVASESLPITTKHVECYDCHNPHAVSSTNRVEGMKFVDIGGTVRDPATGYRQPYVYEICLKCHGNSFNTFIPDQVATGTGAEVGGTLRTTVAQYGCTPNINPASSCTDGSNKRLEFDTATNSADGFGGANAPNRAYHPVAAAGRNTSAALNNQLLGGLTTASTINCTDCHNNEATGAGTFTGATATPAYPGPVTQSNLRATDVTSAYTGASPVGPHGSTNVRVLRANYNTSLGSTTAPPFASFDAANFALCFNCHNIEAFTDADGIVGVLQMTNFRLAPGGTPPKSNLHALHLTDYSGLIGWDKINGMYTSCANCHYNVHSNAEATNTEYGTATGAGLPADGDTHLVNFSPIVAPLSFTKPRWWYDPDVLGDYMGPIMRCNLTCHGVKMGLPSDGLDAWYRYYDS